MLIGCEPGAYEQELLVYSGTHEILVTSLYTPDGESEISARTVARGLRPLNTLAAWPLPRPTPLSCHEFLANPDEAVRLVRLAPACASK